MSAGEALTVAAAQGAYGKAFADFRAGACSRDVVDAAAAMLREAQEADRLGILEQDLLPALEDYRYAASAAQTARVRFEEAKQVLLRSGFDLSEAQRSTLLDHDALTRLTPQSLLIMLRQSPHVVESDAIAAMRGLASLPPVERKG